MIVLWALGANVVPSGSGPPKNSETVSPNAKNTALSPPLTVGVISRLMPASSPWVPSS